MTDKDFVRVEKRLLEAQRVLQIFMVLVGAALLALRILRS